MGALQRAPATESLRKKTGWMFRGTRPGPAGRWTTRRPRHPRSNGATRPLAWQLAETA